MTKRRPPPPAPPPGTEQRILDAAHTVFVRKGTTGARMQDIAKEAGVNQALLHYYFRSKDRLSEAVFRRAATQLMPKVFEVLGSALDLDEKVARVIEIEIEQLSRTPFLPGYVLGEVTHHPERAGQLFSSLTGLVPGDVRPHILATLRRQIDARVRAGAMHAIAPEQFIVNLLALCIFPFAARPMIMAILGLDERGFTRFIDDRRRNLAGFFMRALQS